MMAKTPATVDLDGLRGLLERDVQLVEVLPPRVEYEWGHLPGALHIPLKRLTAGAVRALDRGKPVAVYCWDAL